LGWYAINILRRRFDMCSDLNMPGSAAVTGLSLGEARNGRILGGLNIPSQQY
jgi:hypothetical protein